jgi:c-di-GMP-binding flagellar brake protein YcgR
MPPETKKPDAALAAQREAKRKIDELLEEAVAQRSKFHLAFEPGVSTLKSVTGALYSFDNFNIVLELVGMKGYSQKWQGETVCVYFEIVDRGNRQGVFYTFEGRIQEIKEKEGERLFLHLGYPAAVDRAQRRRSLRVRAHLDHIALLTMWVYEADGKFDLSDPFLRLDDFASGLVKLEDVSAGGMRLLFTPPLLSGKTVAVAKGLRLIVSAKVKNTRCPGDKEAWLIARVGNVYENPVTRNTEAGVEFIAEGKINPNNKVTWKKVEGNVVENVGAWTYTWYLQLIR